MTLMNFDEFIHANRNAFEQDGPSAGLWERIADQLPDDETPNHGLTASNRDVPGTDVPSTGSTDPRSTPVNGKPFGAVHRNTAWVRQAPIRWAAAVALLLLAGGFWWMNSRYGVTQQPEVLAVSPSYAKEVTHYASLIDDKRDELRQLTESNPALYNEFSGDLESLEASYQTLKADLPDTPNQEVLIQAMIQNLQLQIDLLNEQLRVIQRIKQQTNESAAKPI